MDLPLPDFWKGGQALLIHPGSGSAKKNFGKELFLQFQSGFQPSSFVLGPSEIEAGGEWPDSPFVPATPTALAALLIGERAVISNDSGVAHLSAYLGVPTLALFKTTSPYVWRPIGPRVRILQEPDIHVHDASPLIHELFSYKPAPNARLKHQRILKP
jgi:ADP-heptose:LPS heptosyltransferase